MSKEIKDLIRKNLDIVILLDLQEKDKTGYEILKSISQKGKGFYSLKQPTLYLIIKQLESKELITSYKQEISGSTRTFYSATDLGKEYAIAEKIQWEYVRTILSNLISQEEFKKDMTLPFDATALMPINKKIDIKQIEGVLEEDDENENWNLEDLDQSQFLNDLTEEEQEDIDNQEIEQNDQSYDQMISNLINDYNSEKEEEQEETSFPSSNETEEEQIVEQDAVQNDNIKENLDNQVSNDTDNEELLYKSVEYSPLEYVQNETENQESEKSSIELTEEDKNKTISASFFEFNEDNNIDETLDYNESDYHNEKEPYYSFDQKIEENKPESQIKEVLEKMQENYENSIASEDFNEDEDSENSIDDSSSYEENNFEKEELLDEEEFIEEEINEISATLKEQEDKINALKESLQDFQNSYSNELNMEDINNNDDSIEDDQLEEEQEDLEEYETYEDTTFDNQYEDTSFEDDNQEFNEEQDVCEEEEFIEEENNSEDINEDLEENSEEFTEEINEDDELEESQELEDDFDITNELEEKIEEIELDVIRYELEFNNQIKTIETTIQTTIRSLNEADQIINEKTNLNIFVKNLNDENENCVFDFNDGYKNKVEDEKVVKIETIVETTVKTFDENNNLLHEDKSVEKQIRFLEEKKEMTQEDFKELFDSEAYLKNKKKYEESMASQRAIDIKEKESHQKLGLDMTEEEKKESYLNQFKKPSQKVVEKVESQEQQEEQKVDDDVFNPQKIDLSKYSPEEILFNFRAIVKKEEEAFNAQKAAKKQQQSKNTKNSATMRLYKK